MAVTFDAAGPAATASGATGSASETHPVAGNAILGFANVVSLITNNTATMTCGGVSMTELGRIQYDATSNVFSLLVLFGLLNPPTGAQSIVFTRGGTPNASFDSLYFNTVSYFNVASFGTPQTVSSASNVNLTQAGVTSAPNRMAVQGFGKNTTTAVTSPNQTIRSNINNGGRLIPIQDAPGAASLTFSCVDSSNPLWGGIAVDLRALVTVPRAKIIRQAVSAALR